MNGCRWQEKSFSVAVGTLEFYCRDCGQKTEAVYKYNGDELCKSCFNKKTPAKNIGFDTHTSKDKLWEFTAWDKGVPVEIRTKSDFDRYCKRTHSSWRDTRQTFYGEDKYEKLKDKPVPREEIKKILLETAKEKGLYEKLRFREARKRSGYKI